MNTHSRAEPITATADVDLATRPLDLNKETLRDLDAPDAEAVKGGWIRPLITVSCPQPAPSSSNCPRDDLLAGY